MRSGTATITKMTMEAGMRGDPLSLRSNLGCLGFRCEYDVLYRYDRRRALGFMLGSRQELCIREAFMWLVIQISVC